MNREYITGQKKNTNKVNFPDTQVETIQTDVCNYSNITIPKFLVNGKLKIL